MTKILIVVDMQNDFIDGSLGTAEAVACVPAVVEKIKNFDGQVFYTLDTHTEDYLNTREGKRLPVVHCVRGTKGWQLEPKVAAALKEKKARGLEKGGFGSSRLADFIRVNCLDVESIELIGLCTDICVISNAMICRSAFLELPVMVDAACCAGVSPESHERALLAMATCQIDII